MTVCTACNYPKSRIRKTRPMGAAIGSSRPFPAVLNDRYWPIAARYEGLQPTRSCPLWYATNDQKQPSRQTRDHLLLIRWS